MKNRLPALQAGPLPLYHQLKELLTEKIDSGEWEPGYRLPSEQELATELEVSRITVREAMQRLETSGLVERRRGVGTFVARPKVAHNLLSMFKSGSDISRGGGLPSVRLHHVRVVDPSPSVSSHLGLAAGDKAYEMYRSILGDDEPLILFKAWWPEAMFPDLESKGLEDRTLKAVLTDYGVEIESQYKEVEVTILDDEEAALLQSPAGSPAMLVTYLTYMRGHVPFEYRRMIVRGDRCKYFINLDTPELLL